tara:strand:- start:1207 stop:2436 length:1230 start_codon:yes stop_codon:yes gene_type:complete
MKLENPSTCEDCLAFLVDSGKVAISDKVILRSMYKQLSRQTPMTDRQYALVKQKLLTYGRFWQQNKIDIQEHINNLKYPLREIDRSHWLKILHYNGEEILGIRFPFNKKVIDRIEELRRLSSQKVAEYKDCTHYFALTPQNIFGLVEIANRFNSKFVIHKEITEIYNQLLEYSKNKDEYVPGVYSNEVKNIPQVAVQNLQDDLGKCDWQSLALYYDRRFLYDLNAWDLADVKYSVSKYSTLAQDIIQRKQAVHLINRKLTNINDLISAVMEIKRLPMLVVLDNDTAHDNLFEVHNALKYIIPANEMSVLFRKDGDDPFNEYIKGQGLNNLVDNNTKIVYISSNKLPKPLLSLIVNKVWNPSSSLTFNGTKLTMNHVSGFLENMDLRIVYDATASGFYDRNERKYIRANL